VALRFDDLEDRVLSIERGVSADVLGPTKTGRTRRLTLGRQTVELWRSSAESWAGRLPEGVGLGPWLFSPAADHHVRLTAGASATGSPNSPDPPRSRGRRYTGCAIVWRRSSSAEASCSVQQRLGHRDPSTTLRNYAHAMPLEDETVADDIDELLRPVLPDP
jgi:integrase